MKRIAILIMVCLMALVFIPTLAYTANNSDPFIDGLNKAVKQVRENSEYTEARLHEAHWVLDKSQKDFESVEVIFDIGEKGDDKTIFIEGYKDTSGSREIKFENAESLDGKWEDQVIAWPTEGRKFQFDLSHAQDAVNDNEKMSPLCEKYSPKYCNFSYDEIILENPDNKQAYPYFLFGGPGPDNLPTDVDEGVYVAESTKDGSVLAEEDLGEPIEESGLGDPLVKIGTKCASRITGQRFSGGKWIKNNSAVICKKNPPRNINRIRVTESRCRVDNGSGTSQQVYNVHKLGRSCRENIATE